MHILYVDESGDDGFSPANLYQPGKTPSRYFIRTGLVIHDHKWTSINKKINEFKFSEKIPAEIELHATEILNGKKKINGKKDSILNWFGSNYPKRDDRIKLLLSIYNFIVSLDLTIFFIIIDKSLINNKSANYKTLPKSNSWEFLIERYNLYLQNQKDNKGIIISDAIETQIEKNHREFAKAIFAESMHVKEHHFIESILFEPSESSNLLQIADISSYAVGRKYNSNDDVYFKAIEPKIFTYRNKTDGYGLKLWPT